MIETMVFTSDMSCVCLILQELGLVITGTLPVFNKTSTGSKVWGKKTLTVPQTKFKRPKKNCKIFLIAFNYNKGFVVLVCTLKKKIFFGTVLTISCQVISSLPFEFLMLNVSNVYRK